MERTGEALSSRDPHGGEEVGAFANIQCDRLEASGGIPLDRSRPLFGMFLRGPRSHIASHTSRIRATGPVHSHYSTVASKTRPKTVFSGIQPTGVPHVSCLSLCIWVRKSHGVIVG